MDQEGSVFSPQSSLRFWQPRCLVRCHQMTPTRVHVSVAILRVVGFLWPLACGTDFWQRDATRKKRRPCQLAQWIFATPFSHSEASVISFLRLQFWRCAIIIRSEDRMSCRPEPGSGDPGEPFFRSFVSASGGISRVVLARHCSARAHADDGLPARSRIGLLRS